MSYRPQLGIFCRWSLRELSWDCSFRYPWELAADLLAYESQYGKSDIFGSSHQIGGVESLVVKRLFELAKLGMSGAAYKMLEKIGQALRTRAEAICAALAEYNLAAGQLDPPRAPALYVGRRDRHGDTCRFRPLTRHSDRHSQAPVGAARPPRGHGSLLGIQRAKEEMRRLNVEIVRFISFMVDDHVDYVRVIRNHVMVAPDLASELSRQWQHHTRIHELIALKFISASRLVGDEYDDEYVPPKPKRRRRKGPGRAESVRETASRPAADSEHYTPPRHLRSQQGAPSSAPKPGVQPGSPSPLTPSTASAASGSLRKADSTPPRLGTSLSADNDQGEGGWIAPPLCVLTQAQTHREASPTVVLESRPREKEDKEGSFKDLDEYFEGMFRFEALLLTILYCRLLQGLAPW
ncbi:hypothetical protein B0H13DRAFT_2302668 [Mycena leptocephala]|nr:hypothetical protein B0H13DRAFT_2302668 [Mycena leptocephala]